MTIITDIMWQVVYIFYICSQWRIQELSKGGGVPGGGKNLRSKIELLHSDFSNNNIYPWQLTTGGGGALKKNFLCLRGGPGPPLRRYQELLWRKVEARTTCSF